MQVKVNGVETSINDGSTVADLAEINGVGQTGTAIAVNNALVRRANWQSTPLKDGDDVVIIKAAYGG
jgi:sulfur carrier protein